MPQPASAFEPRAVQQFVGIADAEMVAAFILVEFVPGDGGRHRRTFAGARRIRHHRRRAALIAQPVEEDAALALRLADVGGEHLRLGLGDGAAEALGEALDRRPVLRRIERDDDVDALAAGEEREAFEPEVARAARAAAPRPP